MWWRPAPSWDYTWGWFTAGFFTGYVVDRVLKPVPYYYGTNVYYVGDMVYVNGVPYVSASTYYSQAAEIAARGAAAQAPVNVTVNVEAPVVNIEAPVHVEVPRAGTIETQETAGTAIAVPSQDESQDEWVPIGTFAVLNSPTSTDTSLVIQLATNKSGLIAGNIIDMNTDEMSPVYGAIDPETQRVALRVEGREEIVECGLWNLTQDTLPILLHVDEETTEERTFVRLTDPEKE